MTKEKKSFRKFASKHLATVIETRRKTAKGRKEKKERVEKKKVREAKSAVREERDHQADLERLKDHDPQFYSFLEEEDPTLLQFGQEDVDILGDGSGSDAETDADDDDVGGDEGEGEDDEKEGGVGSSRGKKQEQQERKALPRRLSAKDVRTVVNSKDPQQLCNLFLSAVRELGAKLKFAPHPDSTRKFEDPALVKESLVSAARAFGDALPALLSTSKNGVAFKKHSYRGIAKRFLLSFVVVVAEGSTDGSLAGPLMQTILPFVPMLHLIHGCTKAILRVALHLCSHAEEKARLASYMVVRAVATRAAGTRTMYQSSAFKGIFLTLVKAAHTYTLHTLPVVAFLMNAVVDLYGTDLEAAYQHCFVYLRQLAIYLRAALVQQSASNVRTLFNWQYVNALRTWGLVVSSYAQPSQLGPLIHPVVQVALGFMDLFSSPRVFPLHLHLLEMLNHLSARAGVYIPVTTYILRILTSPSIAINAKDASRGMGEHVDLQFTMRVKKSQMRSSAYHVSVWQECLYLLVEHLAANSHLIGFPEAFWAVQATLNKLKKEVKFPKIVSMLHTVSKHFDATARAITAKRDKVAFGPCDVDDVKMFEDELKAAGNPLQTYYATLRATRMKEFSEKQANLNERGTLEDAVEKGERERKKRRMEQRQA